MSKGLNDLWDDLKATAEKAWEGIVAAEQDFEHRIVPIIEEDIALVLSQFTSLAIDTVLKFAKAEFDHMTGQEKHSEVVTAVFQAAEAEGKAVAINDVRMFAQQAYDALATTLKPK